MRPLNNIPLAIIAVLLHACGQGRPPAEAPADSTSLNTVSLTDAQLRNGQITTGKPQVKKISRTLKVNGRIDVPPQNLVSISAPLGGYVRSIKLLPGMHVRKGEVLAVMEDVQFVQLQQDYLSAKARLQYLQLEYERQRELNAQRVNSDKVFQETTSEYSSQKVLVKALEEKLSLIGIQPAALNEQTLSRSVSIRAPINGYVAAVKVNAGKYVTPTEVLCELIDPSDIHLGLNVFEQDVNALRVGQEVSAYTNQQPAALHKARIILITHNLDTDRTAEVHCHFHDYDPALVPGMFMNAEIAVNDRDGLVVPDEAIVRWQNRHYVFVAKDAHTFEMTPVETGYSQNGQTAILAPEAAAWQGRELVLRNAYVLLMKLKNTAEEE